MYAEWMQDALLVIVVLSIMIWVSRHLALASHCYGISEECDSEKED